MKKMSFDNIVKPFNEGLDKVIDSVSTGLEIARARLQEKEENLFPMRICVLHQEIAEENFITDISDERIIRNVIELPVNIPIIIRQTKVEI